MRGPGQQRRTLTGMRSRDDPAQIGPPPPSVPGEKGHARSRLVHKGATPHRRLPPRRPYGLADRQIHPEHGPHPDPGTGLGEAHGTGEGVAIGEREDVHPPLRGTLGQPLRVGRPVPHGEPGDGAQMREARHTHLPHSHASRTSVPYCHPHHTPIPEHVYDIRSPPPTCTNPPQGPHGRSPARRGRGRVTPVRRDTSHHGEREAAAGTRRSPAPTYPRDGASWTNYDKATRSAPPWRTARRSPAGRTSPRRRCSRHSLRTSARSRCSPRTATRRCPRARRTRPSG